ncbi:MAG: 1-deoxy-D-xylulose-5-phosphate synthase [Porphyromonadaceae bacterium CG2_30_38_12]|nr:MAG: 1-deoxy-D-xylulose-5-phosphate synthase [Porphyromonadaceae bacterium CG2_30_38_12]
MTEKKYTYLSKIDFPVDLKAVAKQNLPAVCDELRSFIIDEVSKNPGHLGSNLGSVELAVAIHYVFNTPYDRIVWDVGHQAYGHKILTGRREKFHTNRQFKGLCGFPLPSESEYDAFGVGHSSTAISAALGMAVASLQKNETNRHIVAIVGDGAMTGGLAFEGLNNASMVDNNLLIILNDNQMAIDPIHGGFTQYLIDITTSQTYNHLRFKAYKALRKLGLINDKSKKRIITFNNTVKAALTKQNNIFEGLNIRYFGPVDGHDVEGLVKILNDIKNFKGPKVLHCITQKGKGYAPAEKDMTEWHAPGKFNVETGVRSKSNSTTPTPPLFQDVFGKTLLSLARDYKNIIAITPAMPSGCSMTIMQKEFPERVFDVGIAEGHAVTFSAGLAKDGMIPFCNIYSSFIQRAYDNVIHDVALQNLPVIFCLDRAGLVGSDGATHHGMFDLAYMRSIPNMTVVAPRNEHELRNIMLTATTFQRGPLVIRYPRGKGSLVDWENQMKAVPYAKGECLKTGSKIAVISIGTMSVPANEAIANIDAACRTNIAHYDLRFVKPLDTDLLHHIAQHFEQVITIEDGVIAGGAGSAVLEFFSDNNYTISLKRLGIADTFVEHGTPEELYAMLGLDAPGIEKSISEFCQLKTHAPSFVRA